MTLQYQITKLAEIYQLCISGDHHKDRDCHWSIEQRWEYGETSGWFVCHYGYCYKSFEDICDTYEDALVELELHLKAAIDLQVEYCKRIVSEYKEQGEGFFDYSEYDLKRAKEILIMLDERGYFESK